MEEKRRFGLIGVSLLAGLLMSGAAFAQDETDAGTSEDIVIVIDDGLFVVDPICEDCTGEDGSGEDPTDAGEGTDGGEWVEDGEEPTDVTCMALECEVPAEELYDNPEIYYNTANGGLGVDALPLQAGGRSAVVSRGGPDLCLTPAPELVWLCGALNGSLRSE